MQDLLDFCRDSKVGPIEGLKSYPRVAPTPRNPMHRMQEMEQLSNMQDLPTDKNRINKLLAMQPGMSNNPNMPNNHNIIANNRGALSGPTATAIALTNYQNLMRQNSFNPNTNSLHQEASSSFNNSNQTASSFQGGPGLLSGGSMQNSGFSSAQLQGAHYHHLQRSLSSNGSPQALQMSPANQLCAQGQQLGSTNQQSAQGQSSEQHIIQQLLQSAGSNNSAGGSQRSFAGQSMNAGTTSSNLGYGNNGVAAGNVTGGGGPSLSKSNSFKAPANSDSSAVGGGSNNQRTPEIPPKC